MIHFGGCFQYPQNVGGVQDDEPPNHLSLTYIYIYNMRTSAVCGQVGGSRRLPWVVPDLCLSMQSLPFTIISRLSVRRGV